MSELGNQAKTRQTNVVCCRITTWWRPGAAAAKSGMCKLKWSSEWTPTALASPLALDRGLDRGTGWRVDLDQIEPSGLAGMRRRRSYDVSISETATSANSAKAAAMTKSYRSSLIFRVMMPTRFFVRYDVYKARPSPHRCDRCHEFSDRLAIAYTCCVCPDLPCRQP